MPKKKQKEKVYFTLFWTNKHKTEVTKSLIKRLSLIFIGVVLLGTIILGSGAHRFVIGVIKCKALPVETVSFFTKNLVLPGQHGYGLDPMATYDYCTEESARTAGYGPKVISQEEKAADEAKAQAAEAARIEAERFAPEKVNYVVYVPSLAGYESSQFRLSQILGVQHTFFRIKKNGTVIGQVREIPVDNDYNLCLKPDTTTSKCEVIGHDKVGREIHRSFSMQRSGWSSNYVGINIGGTGIILSSDNDAEAIQLLSSLQQYKEGS
jgi:hypothetical protein